MCVFVIAPSGSHFSLFMSTSSSMPFETTWSTVPGTNSSRFLLFLMSIVMPMKSSMETSKHPWSLAGTGTIRTYFFSKVTYSLISSLVGTKSLSFEHVFDSSHASNKRRSIVTSQMISDIKQTSDGHDDPLKGSLKKLGHNKLCPSWL